MRKFSKISDSPVPDVPQRPAESPQDSGFRDKVMRLLDECLSIRSYGSARPEVMMTTRIVGKEMFVEALADLIDGDEKDKAIRALESLKSEVRDWKAIDEKIEELATGRDRDMERTIADLVDKWGEDDETLAMCARMTCEKIGPAGSRRLAECATAMASSGILPAEKLRIVIDAADSEN